MPIQTEVIIPQKVQVLPNVIVHLQATVTPCTFSIQSANIPGGGILTQTGANTCTVQGSQNLAEWGEVVVRGDLTDGNFGICEVYFLVNFLVTPAGEPD